MKRVDKRFRNTHRHFTLQTCFTNKGLSLCYNRSVGELQNFFLQPVCISCCVPWGHNSDLIWVFVFVPLCNMNSCQRSLANLIESTLLFQLDENTWSKQTSSTAQCHVTWRTLHTVELQEYCCVSYYVLYYWDQDVREQISLDHILELFGLYMMYGYWIWLLITFTDFFYI